MSILIIFLKFLLKFWISNPWFEWFVNEVNEKANKWNFDNFLSGMAAIVLAETQHLGSIRLWQATNYRNVTNNTSSQIWKFHPGLRHYGSFAYVTISREIKMVNYFWLKLLIENVQWQNFDCISVSCIRCRMQKKCCFVIGPDIV